MRRDLHFNISVGKENFFQEQKIDEIEIFLQNEFLDEIDENKFRSIKKFFVINQMEYKTK